MKIILFLFISAFLFSCQHMPIKSGISYGETTNIHSLKHTKTGENYNIKTAFIQIKNIEINLNKHKYNIYQEKPFSNISLGAKYHFSKKWNWLLVDLGLGFKLIETDSRNKWLVEKPFVADFSLNAGIEKEFKKNGIKIQCLYGFQHLSGIGDDRGLNYKKIIFLFVKDF